MTCNRMTALVTAAVLAVTGWGCSVIHSHTHGTETDTAIKTETRGYLIILPLWTHTTDIRKTTENAAENGASRSPEKAADSTSGGRTAQNDSKE